MIFFIVKIKIVYHDFYPSIMEWNGYFQVLPYGSKSPKKIIPRYFAYIDITTRMAEPLSLNGIQYIYKQARWSTGYLLIFHFRGIKVHLS